MGVWKGVRGGGVHCIFMDEGLCRCLIFNMMLWFIIPRQWMLAVSALCCRTVICWNPSHPAAALPPCQVAFCESGNILPGRYCFYKKKKRKKEIITCRLPIWLSPCPVNMSRNDLPLQWHHICSDCTPEMRRTMMWGGWKMEIVNCLGPSPGFSS